MGKIFLIGRHGSGKSTLGRELVKHGYTHISVGLLRRLALKNEFPSDIPAGLMLALKRTKPAEPLTNEVATRLLKHVALIPNCVVDGFPSNEFHIEHLPANSIVGVVTAPQQVRHGRLLERASRSLRQWQSNGSSERELQLPNVIRKSRLHLRTILIANQTNGQATLDSAISLIIAADRDLRSC